MSKLGYAQYILFEVYLDCKNRTKKKIEFKNDGSGLSSDEELIYFILNNCSIVEHDSEKSYQKVSDCMNIICKQLCPGEWCSRNHCKKYSSHCAYNCLSTRPSVCKIYKKYIERKNKKQLRNKKDYD